MGTITVLAAIAVLVLSVGPHFLPYRTYAIEGGSMAPKLPLGSEIVLQPVAGDRLKVGDIITFKPPGGRHGLVTHRIVRIEHRGSRSLLVTKGDANSVPDAWRIPASGTGWRYVFVVPGAGYLVEGLTLPVAHLGLIGLIAFLLGTAALGRIWRPARIEP